MSDPSLPSKIRANAADTAVAAPSHCPTCRSTNISTASKVVDAATYWRCGACGDVWNAGRRRDVSRYTHQRAWRG